MKCAALPKVNTIKDSELKELADFFKVTPRQGYLDI
jgi:rhamnulose-1-phosphate aldolase